MSLVVWGSQEDMIIVDQVYMNNFGDTQGTLLVWDEIVS
jgi:hypothetical protein